MRRQFRQSLVPLWLIALALCSSAEAQQPASPEARDWDAVLQSVTARRVWEFEPGRRQMWEHLRAYLQREFRDRPTVAARRALIKLWRPLADARCQPVLASPARELRITRDADGDAWQGHPGEYQLWLVPLPGQVVLFGYPGPDPFAPELLYYIHQYQLQQRVDDLFTQVQAKARLRDEAQRMGSSRWPMILQRVFPAQEPSSDEFARIEGRGERMLVRLDGQTQELALPKTARLEQLVGQPYDTQGLAPPLGKRIYVAVDWSVYMAADRRRGWLLAELGHALEHVPRHWLVGESVYLHGAGSVTPWPIGQLRRRLTPGRAPTPHRQQTRASLAAAVTSARETDDVRLIFFTWNAQLTVGRDQSDAASDVRLWTNAELRDARSVDLQIVQVHGSKLRMLEQIAGARNYNLFDYRPDGPPAVALPGCQK